MYLVHEPEDLLCLGVVLQTDIGVHEVQQQREDVCPVVYVSLVAADVVSHKKTLLGLYEIIDLKVEDSQTDHRASVFLDLLALLEVVEGLSVRTDCLVPHAALVEASPQLAVNHSEVGHHNARVIFQLFDDLTIVGRGPLILKLGLFAMGHQQAPLGLRPDIDEAIFFFVVIQEVFQIVDLVLLHQTQSLVEVLLDEEARVAVVIFRVRDLLSLLRIQLNVVQLQGVVLPGVGTDGVFKPNLSNDGLAIYGLEDWFSLSVVVGSEMCRIESILLVFRHIPLYPDGPLPCPLGYPLLALEVGLGNAVGHADTVFLAVLVQDQRVVVEVDAPLTLLALLQLGHGQLIHILDGQLLSFYAFLNHQSDVVTLGRPELVDQSAEDALKVVLEGIQLYYFCGHRK